MRINLVLATSFCMCVILLCCGCPLNLSGEFAGGGGVATAGPLKVNEVRFWAYQIQQVDAPGAVGALETSSYDMLVIDPTRTDWSSDARNFDTRAAVERLKRSASSDGMHRKLVVAYI